MKTKLNETTKRRTSPALADPFDGLVMYFYFLMLFAPD
jgi:hypothetical protein